MLSDKEVLIRSTIHYYCLHGFNRMMANTALEGIRVFPSDHKFRLYYGISLLLEARYQEAIRELDNIQEDQNLVLASLLALIHAHKACKSLDREEISKLEGKLRDQRKQAKEVALYFAGLYLLFVGRFDKSREYLDRMLKLNNNLREASNVLGWLELLSGGDKSTSQAAQFFDKGVKLNDPEAILGKSKCLERSGSYWRAIEQLNQMIVLQPSFIPAFIEKMKLQVALKDWEQAIDTAGRILTLDRHCIEAHRYLIIYDLVWEGNEASASSRFDDLISSLEIREPKNGTLLYETGKLISRLAFNKKRIIEQTYSMVEKATFLEPNRIEYVLELGHQCLIINRLVDAKRHFTTVTRADEANLAAALGVLHCAIIEDPVKAADQVEAMEELHKSTGMNHDLMYLCCLWNRKMGRNHDQTNQYLIQIIDDRLYSLKSFSLGLKYYLRLDPQFCLNVVQLCFGDLPFEPGVKGQSLPANLSKAKDLLGVLISNCPGLTGSLYNMARVNYFTGDLRAALCYLDKAVDHEPTFIDGHLLKAKILAYQGNYQKASQTLDIAMGHNFEIRDKLDYIMVKISILKHQKEYDECLKILHNLIDSSLAKTSKLGLDWNSKVTIELEMVNIYILQSENGIASDLLDKLSKNCIGTPEESKILIIKASLAQSRGNVEEALSILREVSPIYGRDFIRSREIMASLYLKHRRDRRLYISCYKDILDKYNDPQSYLMLGDAYMNILEPEKAVEIYEQALKKNPKNGLLTRRVGQALIKTHLFEKAITYYKAALKSSPENDLRFDLATLLYKMKRYPEALDLIMSALEASNNESGSNQDLTNLEWEAKMLNLLAQIQLQTSKKDVGIETLQKSHNMYLKVLRRISAERPDSEIEIKKASIEISLQLAGLIMTHLRDSKRAVQIYKEALGYHSDNVTILTALERLYVADDNLEEARKYSTLILKNAPNDKDSLLMTADLMFRRNDFEGALSHFQQLMDNLKNYYPALARLIEAARRVGKLDIAHNYINKVAESTPRASSESGFNYCKGLASWYSGDINQAIKCFNRSRSDPEFGLMASFHMIEIFINPERGTIGGETFESVNSSLTSLETMNAQDAAIKTASKLLGEIRDVASDDVDYLLMCNFVLLARKQKTDAEIALSEFARILNDPRYKDHPGALLGVASSYIIMKQTQKARTHLKKVTKIDWSYSEAEYLERCWLLLADIYIQSGKFEPAQELLKRVLQYNRSCVKAYEYYGFIMDKSQSFKEAIYNYEMAWKIFGANYASVGFKLAHDYMKVKRYADAIDVAQSILEVYPDYPRIRKDIIEKARVHLKN
ncbi:tetratricopeptide repeat protein 21B-like [Tetranychus urticae]|nr:tetratricopeptide repeat protein 21B-like [Tetranychus urticae]